MSFLRDLCDAHPLDCRLRVAHLFHSMRLVTGIPLVTRASGRAYPQPLVLAFVRVPDLDLHAEFARLLRRERGTSVDAFVPTSRQCKLLVVWFHLPLLELMPPAGTGGLTYDERFERRCRSFRRVAQEAAAGVLPCRPTAGWERRVNPRAGWGYAASTINSFIARCLRFAPSPNHAAFSRLP